MDELTQAEARSSDGSFRGCFEKWCLFLISLHTCALEAYFPLAEGKQRAEQWIQVHPQGRGNAHQWGQAAWAEQAVQFCFPSN